MRSPAHVHEARMSERRTRTPCPQCSYGIVGAHMKRHQGSKQCQANQRARQMTRAMFPHAGLCERLRKHADNYVGPMSEIAEALAILLEERR